MYLVTNQVPPQNARDNYAKRRADQPANTITGQGATLSVWSESGTRDESAVKITPQEAAILQSYPPDFEFAGNKGSVGLQIGNACPPLLTERILEELWT